jgi:hypothetical protein
VEIANSINRQLTTLLVRKTSADWSRRETSRHSQQHLQEAHLYSGKENLSWLAKVSLQMSRESGEEDLGAAGLLRGAYSAGPVSQICFT